MSKDFVKLDKQEYEFCKQIAKDYYVNNYNQNGDKNQQRRKDSCLLGVLGEYAVCKYLGVKFNSSTSCYDNGIDLVYDNVNYGVKSSDTIYPGGAYLDIDKVSDNVFAYIYTLVRINKKTVSLSDDFLAVDDIVTFVVDVDVEILGMVKTKELSKYKIEQKRDRYTGRWTDIWNYRIPYENLESVLDKSE